MIAPGTIALVQVHGRGICTCHRDRGEPCEHLWRGWITTDGQGHYSLDSVLHYTNRAVTAKVRGDRLAGILRYDIHRGVMTSVGTFVAGCARRSGLGLYLWETAIHYDKPDAVEVTCISHKGYTLICRLIDYYPHIEWTVLEQNGKKRRLSA